MNRKKIVLMALLLFLLGCSDKNPHKGLYNALFTNYDKRLSTVEHNLTDAKLSETQLENEYKVLDQNVTDKEMMLTLHKEIDEVSLELDALDVEGEDVKKIKKIKKIIQHMKKTTIKNYH